MQRALFVHRRSLGCFSKLAEESSGLEAEGALFGLVQLARESNDAQSAPEHGRAYQRRFPDGLFAPEVGFAVIELLNQLGRSPEARTEAQTYLRAFPGAPHAPQARKILDAPSE